MKPTDTEYRKANERMRKRLKTSVRATAARYDQRTSKIVVSLDTGLELAFPTKFAQGLKGAKATDLSVIELTPTGLGLHWPKLDADLYLPALLAGVFGSKHWMAGVLGTAGGQATTPAKKAAARSNGRLGGRPKKTVAA